MEPSFDRTSSGFWTEKKSWAPQESFAQFAGEQVDLAGYFLAQNPGLIGLQRSVSIVSGTALECDLPFGPAKKCTGTANGQRNFQHDARAAPFSLHKYLMLRTMERIKNFLTF